MSKDWLIQPFERSKTKDGKLRTKVAIIGFAGTSRHLAPYDDDEWECWLLNESHRQAWARRITRHFQIHQRWDFTKQSNEAYREHFEWLQEEHPFPIYMQQEHDDVPSSVKYPLEEITERFLSKVKRGEKGTNQYFTSSYAYMMAFALFLDFDTIGTWGFEMATDTEYRFQKGSTEYLMGVATGLGKEVYIPESCRLLSGALYGWETGRMINRQRLEFLENRYVMERDRAVKDMNRINGRRLENDALHTQAKGKDLQQTYAIRGRELLQQEIRSNAIVNEKQGRANMLKDLINTVDNMHAGKDPGDGFFGPESDLDPELEQQRQDQAEAAAEAEKSAEGSVAETSEGG